MRRFLIALTITLVQQSLFISTAHALTVEWPVAQGGNGHVYELVEDSLCWTDARIAAFLRTFLAATGHLVTITSPEENAFISAHFTTNHQWIGAFQFDKLDEPAGHWQWVTGEPFVYTNWATNPPNNEPNESGIEDWAAFGGAGDPGLWQDWKSCGDSGFPPAVSNATGYFVEYEPPFVPVSNIDLSNLLTISELGVSFEVIAPDILDTQTAYVTDASGSTGVAVDANGNSYVRRSYQPPGYSFDAISKTTPGGVTRLFAYLNLPEGFTGGFMGMTFDLENNMILLIYLDEMVPPYRKVKPLIRITGFGPPNFAPLPTPVIFPQGGAFTEPILVTISTVSFVEDIRFTLDGSAPTELSPLYTGPIPIAQSATVKAKAFKTGWPGSDVASADFTIGSSTPPTFLESAGQVVMEAESFDANTPRGGKTWTLETSQSGFSGSGYVTALPNTGTSLNSGYVTTSPELTFNVNFTTTGTYYVWVRGSSSSGNDDSLHAGLDGAGPASADRVDGYNTTSWVWKSHTLDSTRPTLVISTPGVHTIHLWMREDGLRVDKLLLRTSSSTTAPSGTGPAESPRSP